MDNCIFCKIVKGEIPAEKIYEDKDTFAFLDIAPAQPKGGHTLVIPKKHYELISDLSDDDAVALMLAVKKISKALLKCSEGLNVLQNNKAVSGQLVPHVHVHLVPRFQNDGIIIEKWLPHKYPKGEMNKIAEQIKELLKEVK